MMIAIVPIVIAIIGLLTYALASNAKLCEVGRLMFFAGLLVTCFVVARATVRLGLNAMPAPAEAVVQSGSDGCRLGTSHTPQQSMRAFPVLSTGLEGFRG